MVLTDDESWFERSIYGHSQLPTPNFDRIANAGVLFTHAYCSAPSCAPARGALLTGRNFWELEQGAFIQAWLPKKFPTYPLLLEQNGYFVGKCSKVWGPGTRPAEAHQREGGPSYQDVINPDHEAQKYLGKYDYRANLEIFLDRKPADQPFCFWIGATEPHAPWPKNGAELLEKEYGVSLDDIRLPGFLPDTPGVRREYANALYEICYVDKQLGKVLDLLEERGELQNTLIITSGDNGSTTARAKASLFDAGVHVPMAVAWPGHIPAGRRVDDFVGFLDVAPTVLEAAGVPVPDEMSGRSFLDVLLSEKSGQVDASRDWTINGVEWHGEVTGSKAGRCIRMGDYAYILHYGQPKSLGINTAYAKPDEAFPENYENAGLVLLLSRHSEHPQIKPYAELMTRRVEKEELYDLGKDPWQMTNVFHDPAYAEIAEKLKARMNEVQLQTRDPRATGEMDLFEETLEYVLKRKRNNYKE
jgi:uncharacterized sulfatase